MFLSYNILNNRLDVEECMNDSYLGVWNVIPPERPNPLLTFICKIVRNISIKKYHAKTAVKRNSTYDVAMSEVANYILSSNNVESEIDIDEIIETAKGYLIEKKDVAEEVKKHWEKLASGWLPECVKLKETKKAYDKLIQEETELLDIMNTLTSAKTSANIKEAYKDITGKQTAEDIEIEKHKS